MQSTDNRLGGAKKLAVKTARGWEWVFCRIGGAICTTSDKNKALPWMDHGWFQTQFSNMEFRAMKSLPVVAKTGERT